MLCVMWFGMCTFVLNDVFQVYVTQFYESGGRRLPSSAFRQFSSVWLAVTVLLTAGYLIQIFVQFRRGARPNPLKFLFIALTFVYLRFTASQIDNPAIGYAMFEMWHDVQYLFIVWSFNVGRVRANPEAGRFLRFLFRPRFGLVVLYVGACLAFGSLTHAWNLFSEPTIIRVVAAIVPATAMLHYYLDGFIWRIREPETRAALGVATRISTRPERTGLLPPRFSPAMRHAVLWLVLILPSSVLFALEYENADRRPIPVVVYEKLVATFPDSPRAQYELGRELQEAGRLEEGKVHLERSVALAPRSHRTLTHLGVLLADQGNAASAKGYFERALEIRPSDAETRNNLAIVLEDLGNLRQARVQLVEATRLDPDYALAHSNLGIVLGKLGDAEAGIREMEQALRLDPLDAGIHNSLGELLVKVNRKADAKTHFAEALRLQPGFRQARQNLEALDVPSE